MKKFAILVASLLVMGVVCSAQQKDNEASTLTAEQAKSVAKILKQHNVMMNFCGCCEKSSVQCIKIGKVTYDSVSVNVSGVNIETGAKYSRIIDVADIWVPQLRSRRISDMQCVGLLAGIQCDPCMSPSLPTGKVGEDMLTMELDGLMEAHSKKHVDKAKSVEFKDHRLMKKTDLVDRKNIKSDMKKRSSLNGKRFDKDVAPVKKVIGNK